MQVMYKWQGSLGMIGEPYTSTLGTGFPRHSHTPRGRIDWSSILDVKIDEIQRTRKKNQDPSIESPINPGSA